jgi:hypothetical protein
MMNLQPPDIEEFPGTPFEFWEYRLDNALRTLHAHQQATLHSLIEELMTSHVASDFESWFVKIHGMTLAAAWQKKAMRKTIAEACDCWASAQAAQRKQLGVES